MSEEIKKSVLNLFNKAKDAVTEIAEKAKDELESSGALDQIEKKATEMKSYMDENGYSEKAEQGLSKLRETTDIASDHLDKLSGKKILELVESRLDTQTQYNDILASKLEEALSRISVLEEKIKDKK